MAVRGAILTGILSLAGAAQTLDPARPAAGPGFDPAGFDPAGFDPEKIRAAMEQSVARQKDAIQSVMQPAVELQQASTGKQPGPARRAERIPPIRTEPPRAEQEFFRPAWPAPESLVSRLSYGGTSDSMPPCPPIPASILFPMIETVARREGLSPPLLREVVRQESAFRPCAESSAGAQGLMQLMPATQAYLGVSDPFDVGQSLAAGSRYLKQLLDRYGGDIALALGAYNAGPARVDRAGGVPAIAETRNYVRSILDRLPPE
jgi:soluble lytic murein transglycosylase-like protein